MQSCGSSRQTEEIGGTSRITVEALVEEMVREDLRAAERDELVKSHHYTTMEYKEKRMPSFTILTLPTFTDARGSLTVLQDQLPFDIVRTYWIYGAGGQTRGGHRHLYSRQALIAVNGQVTIYMNDGKNKEDIILNTPMHCLLVEPKDWHTMTFEEGAVLLVMSSNLYDRSEYIDTPYARVSHD